MPRWVSPRPGRSYLAGAPMLVAHRGGARLAPENTVEAFTSAVRLVLAFAAAFFAAATAAARSCLVRFLPK